MKDVEFCSSKGTGKVCQQFSFEILIGYILKQITFIH